MFSCVFSTHYATGWESEVDTLLANLFDGRWRKGRLPGKHVVDAGANHDHELHQLLQMG